MWHGSNFLPQPAISRSKTGTTPVWYQITRDVLPDNLEEYQNLNGEPRK